MGGGAERLRRDLLEVGLCRRLDDEVRARDELVQREERHGRAEPREEALALRPVPRRRAGQREARQSGVERATDRAADHTEPDDADPHDRELVGLLTACLAYGRVDLFGRQLEGVLAAMEPSPTAFVAGFDPRR